MIVLKYGPIHTVTLEAGPNISDLIAQAVDLWSIDGELSAHATSGSTFEGEYIPKDGSEIVLRNSEPAKKGC